MSLICSLETITTEEPLNRLKGCAHRLQAAGAAPAAAGRSGARLLRHTRSPRIAARALQQHLRSKDVYAHTEIQQVMGVSNM